MRYFVQTLAAAAGAALFAATSVGAQTVGVPERVEEAFASENAILDTSIPFAIGAREARQALRGAFGWPSFQEGLVEGVYFRFDPDGYARFAPTPRLDVDVFEVICRPRTYACAARKEGLEAFLTDRGQLQVKLENALAGDQFFVSEGVSEIQVPERILQPLDVPLELLLGSGGELIVRRGGSEVSRVSLKGFSAVTAYLRWIAARQDYSVLPRGWPVPNADGAGGAGSMTQPAAWNSPMPQPQVLAPEYASALAAGIAPATTASPVTLAAPNATAQPQAASAPMADTVSGQELRTELETLKQIILQAQLGRAAEVPDTSPAPAFPSQAAMPVSGAGGMQAEPSLAQLLAAVEGLQIQLDGLQQEPSPPVAEGAPGTGEPVSSVLSAQPEVMPQSPAAQPQSDQRADTVKKLDYLISDLGLDPQAALRVLQMAAKDTVQGVGAHPTTPVAAETLSSPAPLAPEPIAKPVLYQNELVDQILAELETDMMAATGGGEPAEPTVSQVTVEDYILLSRYFKSAVLPELEAMAAQQNP
ncbi:hypothetical protein J7399_02140 [Shimia sp. R9_1]|uniref:hypothetical protein n=1 Tax=Shimia sp. R9_1 TaxID=2821111 RepID=UPI001ADCCC0C|nr:hypothetical protein [Shimia sp. R9_1]MBO9406213.1 hypothetical protein [Shimia sp. R9_1]